MLWAIHLSDGFLRAPWLAGGFVAAITLMIVAARKIEDREIPLLGVLTSLFFVATLIHVRIGPSSVHLLFNGLVGILAGRRSPIVISIGLTLQAALLAHGGLTTLGINSTVMTIPALLAGMLFQRIPPSSRARALLGGLLAALAVLLTLALQAAVLMLGGLEDWRKLSLVLFTAQIPIMVVEAVVTSTAIAFLSRTRPELLTRERKV